MACQFPHMVKLKESQWDSFSKTYFNHVPVPCGKCYECIKRRQNEWAFRLMQEIRRSRQCYFVTLTYNTNHVPFTSRGFKTLNKADLRDFFKRLRYHHQNYNLTFTEDLARTRRNLPTDRLPIKYYAVGEYGSIRKRPHYHIILYNTSIRTISRAWRDRDNLAIGTIKILPAHHNTIFYTLKYMDKLGTKMPKGFDGVKEFAVQSQYLGDNYLTPQMISWHRKDPDNNYCITERGYKIAMPRYYRDQIHDENSRMALIPHIRAKCEEHRDKFEQDCNRKGQNPYLVRHLRIVGQYNKLHYQMRHRDVY